MCVLSRRYEGEDDLPGKTDQVHDPVRNVGFRMVFRRAPAVYRAHELVAPLQVALLQAVPVQQLHHLRHAVLHDLGSLDHHREDAGVVAAVSLPVERRPALGIHEVHAEGLRGLVSALWHDDHLEGRGRLPALEGEHTLCVHEVLPAYGRVVLRVVRAADFPRGPAVAVNGHGDILALLVVLDNKLLVLEGELAGEVVVDDRDRRPGQVAQRRLPRAMEHQRVLQIHVELLQQLEGGVVDDPDRESLLRLLRLELEVPSLALVVLALLRGAVACLVLDRDVGVEVPLPLHEESDLPHALEDPVVRVHEGERGQWSEGVALLLSSFGSLRRLAASGHQLRDFVGVALPEDLLPLCHPARGLHAVLGPAWRRRVLVVQQGRYLGVREMISVLSPALPLQLRDLVHRCLLEVHCRLFGSELAERTDVGQVRKADQHREERKCENGLPGVHDVLRVELEDEQQPQVGKDREAGGNQEDVEVLDLPDLTSWDAADAHGSDDQQVEGRAAYNG
mmetsp:Transcript_61449/g.180313  ORF Transcript_61449/g.180313 Transcript_61449/m.180313 type:complete len:507 (+) Transcript_61449:719-2239(+)